VNERSLNGYLLSAQPDTIPGQKMSRGEPAARVGFFDGDGTFIGSVLSDGNNRDHLPGMTLVRRDEGPFSIYRLGGKESLFEEIREPALAVTAGTGASLRINGYHMKASVTCMQCSLHVCRIVSDPPGWVAQLFPALRATSARGR
jgi:hypothetical protein